MTRKSRFFPATPFIQEEELELPKPCQTQKTTQNQCSTIKNSLEFMMLWNCRGVSYEGKNGATLRECQVGNVSLDVNIHCDDFFFFGEFFAVVENDLTNGQSFC